MKPAIREILIFVALVVLPIVYMIVSGDQDHGLTLLYNGYPNYLLIRLLIWSAKRFMRYYRKLKSEQKSILNKTTLSIGAVLLVFAVYYLMLVLGPTATVIDAETGKPVEGAVALAQWKNRGIVIPEGGTEFLDKAKESFSDKNGKVAIGGFWGLYIISLKPSLTVYKPGYVIWDSRWLCPTSMPRTDFNEYNRTVKLLKFDTEAPKWVAEYPKEGGPHVMQDHCFGSYYSGEMGSKYQGQIKFRDIFYDNEFPAIDKERKGAYKKANQIK